MIQDDNTAGDFVVTMALANEQLDGVARYLSRGRRLHSLDEAALKQLWIDEVRRALHKRTFNSMLMDDIGSELSLRGIKRIELPPELHAAVMQGVSDPEVSERIADGLIATFNRISAESKN